MRFRFELGSPSMARIGFPVVSLKYLISRAANVVLPVPPLPATAMVIVITYLCLSNSSVTDGKTAMSVWGRKSADVNSFMKVLSALSSR